ncbi:hypothetical protein C1I95_32465 [Micromonospora craterilacus]|uniref:Uncharacterized protein n=1 Tax=Micromonospora craterilacus TaxID=1655439 RepID=A0A2W2E120_9ACTN|nr:hypothetical protein [Micromonospora craterilacus]PZG05798.1 hypothetical protein C1I95_32465 [Micromonospora craterilacus]
MGDLVQDLVVAGVDWVATHPALVAAGLLTMVCVALLTRIALLLWADRWDRWAGARAVVPAPPAPPPLWPDRPLINPRYVAHVAASSAAFTAALRAGRPAQHGGHR